MPAADTLDGGKWTDRVLFMCAVAEGVTPASRGGRPGRYRRLNAAGKKKCRLLKNQEHAFKDSRRPVPDIAAGRFPIRRAAH
jgi:hypothetical protein